MVVRARVGIPVIRRRHVVFSLCASALAGPEARFSKISGQGAGGSVLDVGAAGSFDSAWATCPTVLHVNGMYRMWFSSVYDSKMGPGGIGSAESADGIQWRRLNRGRPVLGLGPEGAFDDGQVMGPEVHFDGALYRMWYTGMSRIRHASGFGHYRIGLATSRDGIEWRRENRGRPVLDVGPAGSPDEVQAATPSIVKQRDGYRMWYAAWSPKWSHTVCVAVSRDGISWTRENRRQPVSGLYEGGAYGPAVCGLNDGYLLLYMPLSRDRKGLYGATSRDGIAWRGLAPEPLIALGTGDAFDEYLAGHPCLLAEGGRVRAWYTGYRREAGGANGWKLRIGLAEARTLFL